MAPGAPSLSRTAALMTPMSRSRQRCECEMQATLRDCVHRQEHLHRFCLRPHHRLARTPSPAAEAWLMIHTEAGLRPGACSKGAACAGVAASWQAQAGKVALICTPTHSLSELVGLREGRLHWCTVVLQECPCCLLVVLTLVVPQPPWAHFSRAGPGPRRTAGAGSMSWGA